MQDGFVISAELKDSLEILLGTVVQRVPGQAAPMGMEVAVILSGQGPLGRLKK